MASARRSNLTISYQPKPTSAENNSPCHDHPAWVLKGSTIAPDQVKRSPAGQLGLGMECLDWCRVREHKHQGNLSTPHDKKKKNLR